MSSVVAPSSLGLPDRGAPHAPAAPLVEPQRLHVALLRDPLDGTLGIDLDQFAGLPTVAIVVPGGPADRLGAVRPGDVSPGGASTSSLAG